MRELGLDPTNPANFTRENVTAANQLLEQRRRERQRFEAGLKPEPQPGPGVNAVALAKQLRQQGILRNEVEEGQFIQSITGRPDAAEAFFSGLTPEQLTEFKMQGVGGILSDVKRRIGERQQGPSRGTPHVKPKKFPAPKFTFPSGITSTSQAVQHLQARFGMSREDAIAWLKRNPKSLGF